MKRTQVQRSSQDFDYDVCLSFAGENRGYVRRVAKALLSCGVRVFYDEYAQADIWGKDLFTHLDDVYQNAARYCVLFASRQYAARLWTNHERQSAQARAFRQHSEYLLPARFDKTEIPGLRPTVGYIDLTHTTPTALAKLVVEKIGERQRENYFPPIPDSLFEKLRARTSRAQERAKWRARGLFDVLRRMDSDERTVVLHVFLHACAAGLPQNAHVSLDLLRRLTAFSESKIVRLAGGLRSLGFMATVTDEHHDGYLGKSRTLALECHDLAVDIDGDTNITQTAYDILQAASVSLCEECSFTALQRLDFSQLAKVTSRKDPHALPSASKGPGRRKA